MRTESFYQQLRQVKLLPLYTASTLDYLEAAENLLLKHDIPIIEVTFRSNLALPAIKQLAQSTKLLVGAGTVRTKEEAMAAVENGAKFIVSPAIVPEVIEYCIDNHIPILPGTATPSDIQKAWAYGIRTVKFFPADIYGGLKAIKSLSGPFYDMQFLPTGGIDEHNFETYLSEPQVIAVGGSFILSESSLKPEMFENTDEKLRQLVSKRN